MSNAIQNPHALSSNPAPNANENVESTKEDLAAESSNRQDPRSAPAQASIQAGQSQDPSLVPSKMDSCKTKSYAIEYFPHQAGFGSIACILSGSK